MVCWMILHQGDCRWIYQETQVLKHVNGLPFVELTGQVTSPEFLFPTEKKACRAAKKMTRAALKGK